MDRLLSSRAILWNGLLVTFGGVVFNGVGAGITQSVAALLWVVFCLLVLWAGVKMFVDSGYLDLVFSVTIAAFQIAIYSLSFR